MKRWFLHTHITSLYVFGQTFAFDKDVEATLQHFICVFGDKHHL